MAINKFTVSLTFGEVEKVVSKLRKLRDTNAYLLNDKVEGYVTDRRYNSDTKEYEDIEPYVQSYSVTGAEQYVQDFAEITEIISWFTGEGETLPVGKLAALAAARKRLDEETAAKAAAARKRLDEETAAKAADAS